MLLNPLVWSIYPSQQLLNINNQFDLWWRDYEWNSKMIYWKINDYKEWLTLMKTQDEEKKKHPQRHATPLIINHFQMNRAFVNDWAHQSLTLTTYYIHVYLDHQQQKCTLLCISIKFVRHSHLKWWHRHDTSHP